MIVNHENSTFYGDVILHEDWKICEEHVRLELRSRGFAEYNHFTSIFLRKELDVLFLKLKFHSIALILSTKLIFLENCF